MTIDKCNTCKHSFTTGKDRVYCKKSLADSDNCGEYEAEFHCGIEESGFHAYNCNDCPNKCEEWYQWDKEFREKSRDDILENRFGIPMDKEIKE